jgi:hypothetical protein
MCVYKVFFVYFYRDFFSDFIRDLVILLENIFINFMVSGNAPNGHSFWL